jgi:aldehyde dehydrogenase (NAD+)/aldehyde dehydrogenase
VEISKYFLPSVAAQDDKFFSKAVEGLMFALNQGEICTTPSRILVHEDIADLFIERMQARLKLVKAGKLDPETMIGSQKSTMR